MFSVALILLLASGSCVYSIDLIQPDSVVLQPGHTLTITCQVSYSLSSRRTGWIRQPAKKGLEYIVSMHTGHTTVYKESLKHKFNIVADSSQQTVTLNGQNMQPEDTAVYYCASAYSGAFDYWGKGTTVTVTTATVTGPTVFPLQPCDVNDGSELVSLACLATGFTPSSLTFSWTANGNAFPESTQYPPVLKNNIYSAVSQIRVRRQDLNNTQSFRCNVVHQGGNAQGIFSTNTFDQSYQLPTLKVSTSAGENDVTFSCLAKDFTPRTYEFKWLKNNEEITGNKHEITTTSEGKNVNGTTMYSAASFLTVDSQELVGNTDYMCKFKGKGEGGPTFLNATVTYDRTSEPCPDNNVMEKVKINIIQPSLEDLFLTNKANVLCEVTIDNVEVYKIYWLNQDGKEMSDAPITPNRRKGTFNAPLLISYDEWNNGIVRDCLVEVDGALEPLKKTYKRTSGGNTQRPSVFMLPPIEHTKKESVTLTCYVKDFFPADILVSWLVDDEAVDSKYEFNTTNPVENSGAYFVYAHLSVTADQWKEKDTVYSCVVYHESVVNTTKTIVRSIGHRSLETTNLVNLNMNIPETCKAQ